MGMQAFPTSSFFSACCFIFDCIFFDCFNTCVYNELR
jgi:hypothetical protein